MFTPVLQTIVLTTCAQMSQRGPCTVSCNTPEERRRENGSRPVVHIRAIPTVLCDRTNLFTSCIHDVFLLCLYLGRISINTTKGMWSYASHTASTCGFLVVVYICISRCPLVIRSHETHPETQSKQGLSGTTGRHHRITSACQHTSSTSSKIT